MKTHHLLLVSSVSSFASVAVAADLTSMLGRTALQVNPTKNLGADVGQHGLTQIDSGLDAFGAGGMQGITRGHLTGLSKSGSSFSDQSSPGAQIGHVNNGGPSGSGSSKQTLGGADSSAINDDLSNFKIAGAQPIGLR